MDHKHRRPKRPTSSRGSAPPLVRTAWKRLAKTARAVLADESELPGGAPDDEWHLARIAAQRARYVGEAVAPVLGERAEQFARRMERITDVLGEHQDAADTGAAIQELAATADAQASFTFGVLFALGVLLATERAGYNDPS